MAKGFVFRIGKVSAVGGQSRIIAVDSQRIDTSARLAWNRRRVRQKRLKRIDDDGGSGTAAAYVVGTEICLIDRPLPEMAAAEALETDVKTFAGLRWRSER